MQSGSCQNAGLFTTISIPQRCFSRRQPLSSSVRYATPSLQQAILMRFLPANIHSCTEEKGPVGALKNSKDLWSLGFLMLEVMEKGSTLLPDFEKGATLKFKDPSIWSSEACSFLEKTSTASREYLSAVSTLVFRKQNGV